MFRKLLGLLVLCTTLMHANTAIIVPDRDENTYYTELEFESDTLPETVVYSVSAAQAQKLLKAVKEGESFWDSSKENVIFEVLKTFGLIEGGLLKEFTPEGFGVFKEYSTMALVDDRVVIASGANILEKKYQTIIVVYKNNQFEKLLLFKAIKEVRLSKASLVALAVVEKKESFVASLLDVVEEKLLVLPEQKHTVTISESQTRVYDGYTITPQGGFAILEVHSVKSPTIVQTVIFDLKKNDVFLPLGEYKAAFGVGENYVYIHDGSFSHDKPTKIISLATKHTVASNLVNTKRKSLVNVYLNEKYLFAKYLNSDKTYSVDMYDIDEAKLIYENRMNAWKTPFELFFTKGHPDLFYVIDSSYVYYYLFLNGKHGRMFASNSIGKTIVPVSVDANHQGHFGFFANHQVHYQKNVVDDLAQWPKEYISKLYRVIELYKTGFHERALHMLHDTPLPHLNLPHLDLFSIMGESTSNALRGYMSWYLIEPMMQAGLKLPEYHFSRYYFRASSFGEPLLAQVALSAYKKLLSKYPSYNTKIVQEQQAIMEADFLLSIGKSKEAYDLLFKHTPFSQKAKNFLTSYSSWRTPLYSDTAKLAVIFEVPQKEFLPLEKMPVEEYFISTKGELVTKGNVGKSSSPNAPQTPQQTPSTPKTSAIKLLD